MVPPATSFAANATEEQIFDRRCFQAFLGLRIGGDAKTLWDFKQRIESDGGHKLFDAFGQMLEGKGIVAREGSIVDASFTEAPRQPRLPGRCKK
jgi:hypothetical protein